MMSEADPTPEPGAKPAQASPAQESGRPANQRGMARLSAVQALYQMDVGGLGLVQVTAEFEAYRLGKEVDDELYRPADHAWFRSIVAGVVEHQRILDPLIHAALVKGWPLRRLDVTLRAVLRAGTFELLHRKDVPARVIINEYVDVAKGFFFRDEPRIVNGVLDTLARSRRADEFQGKVGH